MEENLILYGCKLAKEMEQNLPMLANQPEALLASCEEIINIFNSVKERLIVSQGNMMSFHGGGGGGRIEEWLRSSGAVASLTSAASATTASAPREPTIDLLSAQAMLGDRSKFHEYLDGAKMKGAVLLEQQSSSPGLDFMFGGGGGRVGAVAEVQPTTNAPDSIKTSPSRNQRRR